MAKIGTAACRSSLEQLTKVKPENQVCLLPEPARHTKPYATSTLLHIGKFHYGGDLVLDAHH